VGERPGKHAEVLECHMKGFKHEADLFKAGLLALNG
jgi:hypothetical protein